MINNDTNNKISNNPENLKDLLTYKDNILYQNNLMRAISIKNDTLKELAGYDSLDNEDLTTFIDKNSFKLLNEDIFSNYHIGKTTTTPEIKTDEIEEPHKKIELLEKLATLKPDNSKVKLALAQNYYKNQDYEKSSELLNEYLKVYPEDKNANILLASVYCKLGETLKATTLTNKVLDLVKEDPEFFKQVGYLNFLINRYDIALDYLGKFLKYQPDDITTSLLIVYSLDKQGNKKEALKKLDELSTKEPDNINILRGKSVMLFESKAYDKAIETINRLLSINDRDKNAYFILEQIYLLQSDFKKAENLLEKYTNVFPLDDEGYFHLANIHARASNLPMALENYRKAVDLDPGNPYYHYVLGAAYLEVGDKNLAMKEYDILKSLNKGYIEEFKAFLD